MNINEIVSTLEELVVRVKIVETKLSALTAASAAGTAAAAESNV